MTASKIPSESPGGYLRTSFEPSRAETWNRGREGKQLLATFPEGAMVKRTSRWLTAIAFVAICFLVSAIGQLFAGDEPDAWYRGLRRPAFTPPDWVFGPVWTLLYIAMGVAAWQVWLRRGNRAVTIALVLFAIQLVLNAAWPGLFFGLHNPVLAFADIVVLWVAIVLTVWTFFRVSKLSGWLMVPYLGWVTFAAVLNMAIWQLNA